MTTTTNIQQVKLNVMTQAQYDAITPSATELYAIIDADTLVIDTSMSPTSTNPVQNKVVYTALSEKQDTLVSGTNIKTLNNESLLGSGNIEIQAGGTVDQTFDGTSENAQSGVAIAGAGFLTGIDSTDVTNALGYTPEDSDNKVTSLSGSSTDTEYPSAKLVYDQLLLKQDSITSSAMLSSDLVNDTNNTHKFATSAQLAQIGTNRTDISTINGKIPSQASGSNQLADKAFVNSSVQTATANFRGNWDTWTLVPTSASSYPTDYAGSTTPTVNDYLVVQDASDYTGDTLEGTWRFKYTGTWATDGKSGWNPEYQVNETPLTSAQLAALNSGITSSDVTLIGTALQPNDNISELTNNAGYITGITSSDVTTALGYTPYNSTNPNGYISSASLSGLTDTSISSLANKQFLEYNSSNSKWENKSLTSSDVTTALGYTPYNSTNPSGYISGITSSDVTTALGYTPYNSTNPSGYITSTTLAKLDDTIITKLSNGQFLQYQESGKEGAWVNVDLDNKMVETALGYTPYNSTNPNGYISGITSSMVTTALGYTPYNSSNPNGYISGITSSDVTTALGYTPYNSTNPDGYITGITSSDVTTALGYTPYNSTNPDGYITSSALTNYVTTNTDQDITGTKTFVGQKKIAFKQSSANDKLGFTLFDGSGAEKGYLEYNPSNKVDNVPLMTLGNYATASGSLTHVGFRKYSNLAGADGAYNLLAPLISDARIPFSLTTTYSNFYLPLGFTNGTDTVLTAKSGMVDISTLISGKQDTLVSGTNIKTINNESLLGSGNITIEGGGTISVDQVYDGTSQNAQSGVAMEGELTTHYQPKLVSGENIKTINNIPVIGSGNLDLFATPSEWSTPANSLPATTSTEGDWYGIAYGDGKYLAISGNGYISTSTDLTTWTTLVRKITATNFNNLAYGNGTFLTINESGDVFSSSDGGENWSSVGSSMSGGIYYLTYTNGKFIAFGTSGACETSIDGETWDENSIPSSDASDWHGVAYNNGRYVAVSSNGYVSISTDLITWSTPELKKNLYYVENDTVESYDWQYVSYINNKFVAISNYGRISESADGEEWTPSYADSALSTKTWYGDLTEGYDKYVLINGDGYISTLNKGAGCASKAYVDSNFSDIRNTLDYKQTRLIEGENITLRDINVDLAGWGQAYLDSNLNNSSNFSWIAGVYGKGVYSLLGYGAYGFESHSTNGKDWTEISNSTVATYNDNYRDAIFADGKFVAIGKNGYIFYNNDGTWTDDSSGYYSDSSTGLSVTRDWVAIAYNGTEYVALSATGYISTSTDLENWETPVQVSALGTNNWKALTYGDGKFLALGTSGYISTSEDGVTWTTATQISHLFSSSTWVDVEYTDKFMFLSAGGELVTYEGENEWNGYIPSALSGVANWSTLICGGGKCIAVSETGYISETITGGAVISAKGGSEPVSSIPPIGYGTSDTAAATVTKEVSIPEITELNVGQIIVINPTVTSTVANMKLKLNDFEAFTILYGGTATTTSTDSIVWSSYIPSMFVYDKSSDGTTYYWRFVCHGQDLNTTYSINYLIDAGQYKAGSGSYAITRYSLIMQRPGDVWEKLTATNAAYSTGTSKSVNTGGFVLGAGIKYYATTTTVANGALTAANIVRVQTPTVDMRYSTNCGATPGWTVGNYVYLVGTIGVDGLFYLDSTTWWANSLPSTNDGKLYVRLGHVISDYSIAFYECNPVFYHDGTSIKEYLLADNKQDKLVSGTNIKTINNTSLLGSGNISIDTDSVFVAEYGVSSFTDIQSAYSAGKSVLCQYLISDETFDNTLTMALTSYEERTEAGEAIIPSFYFTGYHLGTTYTTSISSSDVWGVVEQRGGNYANDDLSNVSSISSSSAVYTQLNGKQATLVSGTNIKTINNESLLGNGNISISGGAIIDDTTPSTTTVYSSQKTQDLIDALVARIVALETNINGGNA